MNICFINSDFPNPTIGGVERVTHELATAFASLGHRVDILLIDEHIVYDNIKLAYNCHLLPEPGIWGSEKNAKAFFQLQIEHHIQVVVIQSNKYQAIQLVEQGLLEGVKVVSVFHTAPIYNRVCLGDVLVPRIWKYGWLHTVIRLPYHLGRYYYNRYTAYSWEREKLQYMVKLSDRFVTLSPRFISPLIKFLKNVDKKKICAIPNPVTKRCVADIELHQKENIILWVGRMDFTPKRVDRVIKIWEKISDSHPDWRLEMIGDGDAKEVLKNYCINHNVSRINFTGRIDPVPYYKKAKILFMTSSYEGWGVVLTEAMSYGCVPIAYDSYDSLHDIICHNENGLIVPAYKKATFCREVEKLMIDEKRRRSLAKNCIHILKKYSLASIVSKWETLFYDIIQEIV